MNLSQHLEQLEEELLEGLRIVQKPDKEKGKPLPPNNEKKEELDEYFHHVNTDESSSYNESGYYKLPSHKRASRVKSMFPDEVDIQGQYIFILNPGNEENVLSYMNQHKIKYIPVEPTGMGDPEELSNREKQSQLPYKFNEEELDESWWDAEDSEVDGFKIPTVKAVDHDSPEGQELRGFPQGKDSRWKDTPKPSDLDKDTEWLGDLEIDAEVPANDDLATMKKMAGINEPEPKQEYNKDWYWHDSEGKVVRDTWGNPVKSGSHPDSQKKQPWDFFDDVDSEVDKEQLDEYTPPTKDEQKADLDAQMRKYAPQYADTPSKANSNADSPFDFGDTGDARDRLDNLKKWRNDPKMPKGKADTGRFKAPEGPFKSDSASIDKPWYHDAYGDSTGTSANYKKEKSSVHADEVPEPVDVDVPNRPEVKHVDIRNKTNSTAKTEPKQQSWWEKQKAQHKAQNPDQYDSKGRQITKNPITGEPNVRWGEKRPESQEGKRNRLERERKAKAYQDKVKKAGGHLNKFGQDVKNMFSGDAYNKAKADHKKKMADRKKLSKHEQNLARLRDLGIF